MSERPPRGLFVTGTDTDVGKTYVTALIARRLAGDGTNVGAYKPACSGVEVADDGTRRWSDVEALHAAIGGRFPRERIAPQTFDAPLAPPVAARLEGRAVERELLSAGLHWWLENVEVLLVEGVGGLVCPLWDSGLVADLAVEAGYPLLIVAHAELGTINHTLLTIEAARSRGLEIAGVLLNSTTNAMSPEAARAAAESNAREIERYGDVRVIGHLPWSPGLRDDSVGSTIDWSSLIGPRRDISAAS